ncbi:MAG TPA: D-amino-acid transaminase [Alphaproteobacteria bacterium]|jgi:D-alanine transaminase|nr:D-amino-acid transaminase [Alphaproteobacteria bacterium]
MARVAYVNGRFVRHEEAAVHIEDRGYQFADGVYEVVTVLGGEFVDQPGHLARLKRSLGELRIAPPVSEAVLKLKMRELVRRNGVRDGYLYLQITRGVAPRDFKFPKSVRSALVMTTRRQKFLPAMPSETGVSVVSVPDIRWTRRDIKSIGLLAQVLAKQAAAEAGAFEAWMVGPDGYVTEGSSSNAWIVTKDGVLVTHQPDGSILHGITGNSLEALARERGITVERRPFTMDEAYQAREAFVTSATTFCISVTEIDGRPIANGHPGELARTLRQAYFDYGRGRQGEPIAWRQ